MAHKSFPSYHTEHFGVNRIQRAMGAKCCCGEWSEGIITRTTEQPIRIGISSPPRYISLRFAVVHDKFWPSSYMKDKWRVHFSLLDQFASGIETLPWKPSGSHCGSGFGARETDLSALKRYCI